MQLSVAVHGRWDYRTRGKAGLRSRWCQKVRRKATAFPPNSSNRTQLPCVKLGTVDALGWEGRVCRCDGTRGRDTPVRESSSIGQFHLASPTVVQETGGPTEPTTGGAGEGVGRPWVLARTPVGQRLLHLPLPPAPECHYSSVLYSIPLDTMYGVPSTWTFSAHSNSLSRLASSYDPRRSTTLGLCCTSQSFQNSCCILYSTRGNLRNFAAVAPHCPAIVRRPPVRVDHHYYHHHHHHQGNATPALPQALSRQRSRRQRADRGGGLHSTVAIRFLSFRPGVSLIEKRPYARDLTRSCSTLILSLPQ
ncbi:hypothetical protein B0T21DRAFT_25501 [Apiosordaria backusii]|uniref:Uncharacterized protein n=1 Tax=Apiosordaria backusii TaxID=314023 RepID=A0AA40EZU3_9PEZI|nr:hypothetical protein B0T21DRAFT_25501 [Apiosordaria backusii]